MNVNIVIPVIFRAYDPLSFERVSSRKSWSQTPKEFLNISLSKNAWDKFPKKNPESFDKIAKFFVICFSLLLIQLIAILSMIVTDYKNITDYQSNNTFTIIFMTVYVIINIATIFSGRAHSYKTEYARQDAEKWFTENSADFKELDYGSANKKFWNEARNLNRIVEDFNENYSGTRNQRFANVEPLVAEAQKLIKQGIDLPMGRAPKESVEQWARRYANLADNESSLRKSISIKIKEIQENML